MDDNFWGGVGDTFSNLAGSYLKLRTAQAQADVVGAGQTQLQTSVEQPQGNGQVPLTSGQLNAATSNSMGGFTQQQMLMGAGALALVVVLIAKR